jgi:CubicO group peptidase (beta-lactamase class C family)
LEVYYARLEEKFGEVFEEQQEAFAVWVGVGDLYFVLGNATSAEEGATPPDIRAALDQTFQNGSISKTFLVTVLLLMYGQGDLSLDDTVEELVPDFAQEFPVFAKYIVSNLLRMVTLIPDFLNDNNGILND